MVCFVKDVWVLPESNLKLLAGLDELPAAAMLNNAYALESESHHISLCMSCSVVA